MTLEYDQQMMALLEAVWGEGFMSPGGVAEVDRYLAGLDLEGRKVLDIGCGLGGIDVHLAKQHHAAMITGIDVEQALIDRCVRLARKHEVSAKTRFLCVTPGPLPFADASFDVVTSKDSILHIVDKQALATDIYRVLEPGGWFAASDWLAGYDGQPSQEMLDYLEAEGLDFELATAEVYRRALLSAGFIELEIIDRNDWYRQQARAERDRLQGDLYQRLAAAVSRDFLDHEVEVWNKMITVLDQGQLRPTHLRGRKARGG